MKYLIYNNNYPQSVKLVKQLEIFLTKKNFTKVSEKPDIIISVGGDGTFLRAVNKYFDTNKEVIFIPVNSGSIGFFSYCDLTNWEKKLTTLINLNFSQSFIQQPLLTIKHNQKRFFAVNEIRIINHSYTIAGDIFINNKLFEFYRGSGLVWSSGVGSTGYSKSIGGSIILLEAQIFQMCEIAPISNNEHRSVGAPIIMPSNYQVKFQPRKKLINTHLVIDGIDSQITIKEPLTISYGEEHLKIVSDLKNNQIKYLSKKLITNKYENGAY